jgi:predicted transcriptional regulator of viral defense system
MKYSELVHIVSELGCFRTGFAASGRDLQQVRLQLSRWVADGRVVRLHKGVYALAPPYRKVHVEPFSIANTLKGASYVSLQSALAWHGLIPEFVPAITSVTAGRPQTIATPLGRYEFRHIKKSLFWGYRHVELSGKQEAFVAVPEKALLDLLYLTPGSDAEPYVRQLRLQGLEKIDTGVLEDFARKTDSPKVIRAAGHVLRIISEGEGEEL